MQPFKGAKVQQPQGALRRGGDGGDDHRQRGSWEVDTDMMTMMLIVDGDNDDHDYIQGGRTWQPFVGSKNSNENFRQARIYNFRVKFVVFASNRKFSKLTQWNMQYIPCNSALLAQETLFLTQKGTFFAQRYPKSA